MYSFEPSEEQKMLIGAVNRYAINDLCSAACEAEENGELPTIWLEKGWELGLLQASIPEAYGGFGERSAVTGVLAAEELAFDDLAGALAVGTPGLFALPILLAGSEEQKQGYLPAITAGARRPYTSALIEYDFDFGTQDLKTTARIKGQEYTLNGEKAFVPFTQEAEAILVYANLDGRTQAFIVSRNTPGLMVLNEREKLMSLNAIPMYRVELENVKVDVADRLGGRDGHGIVPDLMGIGPVIAIPKALKIAGLSLGDIDLIELNEAFAAQSLAVMRELNIDEDKVNVNGGAIALGHPLGCTGAKLTTQLIYEMGRRRSKYGMVTMCVGGGMGAAAVFENLQ